MFGGPNPSSSKPPMIRSREDNNVGIIPRACIEVFDAVKLKRNLGRLNISISVSYVEIYGDQVNRQLISMNQLF
jgi:phenylacetate-coenzyme A ligase PaaK-like adenylate-forming protein